MPSLQFNGDDNERLKVVIKEAFDAVLQYRRGYRKQGTYLYINEHGSIHEGSSKDQIKVENGFILGRFDRVKNHVCFNRTLLGGQLLSYDATRLIELTVYDENVRRKAADHAKAHAH